MLAYQVHLDISRVERLIVEVIVSTLSPSVAASQAARPLEALCRQRELHRT